jgi:uncharacterized protein YegP (UPF0339 family)
MRKLIIEVLQGKSGSWYWRIKASNGRILAHSETYSSRRKATGTAIRLMTAELTLNN